MSFDLILLRGNFCDFQSKRNLKSENLLKDSSQSTVRGTSSPPLVPRQTGRVPHLGSVKNNATGSKA